MAIREIRGDVLAMENSIIVHGCNSLGVMGAGVALAVKKRYPEVFEEYTRYYTICKAEGFDLPLGTTINVKVGDNKFIVNAITQASLKRGDERVVSYDAIEMAFRQVVKLANEEEIQRIAFPLIGAGLGGGNWNIISSIIDNTVPDFFDKVLVRL